MTPGAREKKTYDIFVHPKSGLFRNLALDVEGVKTVLELRSKYGVPQKNLTDPLKYVDLLACIKKPLAANNQVVTT